MINKEATGYKLAEFLMSKGFNPEPETEFNTKGMLLVNKEDNEVIFISLESHKPDYYSELVSKINKKYSIKVNIIAFDAMTLKFEYETGALYITGNTLHKDLSDKYPGINEVYMSNNALSNEVTQVLVKDIQNKVVKDIILETKRAAKVVKSRSDFSIYFLAILFAFAYAVPNLLVQNLLPGVWETINETTKLIMSGASYAALTFEDNQWWRLLTGFLVNDLIWIAIVLLSLRQVIPTVESLYGKTRTIVIFILTGIIVTYAKTIIHAHELSYGAHEVIFCMLGMLLYYGYYDRLLLKMYLPRSIQSFVILGVISIFFNPISLIYIAVSIGLGYLLAAIIGFKNSKTTIEVIYPIVALTSLIAILIFFQTRLNWRYSDVSYSKDLLRELWSKIF